MANTARGLRPAWQTEELEDEWIEPESEVVDEENSRDLLDGTRSISFTAPLSTQIHTIQDSDDTEQSPSPAGTFLVHQDVANAPLLPKTPGRHNKANMKDFFSPLPLERMFEPPSPPPNNSATSPLPNNTPSDEIVATDLPDMVSFDGRKPSLACQFTFAAPQDNWLHPNNTSGPQAESTPGPPFAPATSAPSTEPPLRLFQFQYDTYTREHLSAMVDSIAVNTGVGSGTTNSPTSFNNGLSRVSEITGSTSNVSHLRSAKRVKLSPKSDYDRDGPHMIIHPPFRKDYIGESQSLMQQIKQARDFSTISTVASVRPTSPKERDTTEPEPTNPAPSTSTTTASKYRLQAASLMAQIKSDMKGQKRLFSGDSDFTQRETSPEPSARAPHRHPAPSPVKKASPRRSLRRSTTITDDDELARRLSRTSINAPKRAQSGHLAPPSYPSSSVRASTNEDLGRFVSSSTTTGTTLTSSSVPSSVKPAQIRTIAPSDLPALPDRMGDMMFDRVMMKWVKSSARGDYLPIEEVSEDPFGDIESLRDDSRVNELSEAETKELSRVEEQTEMDEEDAEEMELTSFETDDPRVVDVMTGVEDDSTDSEDDQDAVMAPEVTDDYNSEEEDEEEEEEEDVESVKEETQPPPPPIPDTPNTKGLIPSSSSTVRSVLKTPGATTPYRTPQRKNKHRRSVSFSDGKRDGPIRGLSRNEDMTIPTDGRSSFVPSARSKRIADMMVQLEDSDESPSKASSSGERPHEIQPLSKRVPSSVAGNSFSSRRVFSRHPDNTFLTECSFGVAHDRLVQVITDVEPFEPHWEELSCIDLSGKNIESVARLKEFLPRLDCLKLNSNQVSWLSGVPSTVRTLSVASNSLTGVTSYHHLLNLENLDISRNDIESLTQLACLRHLRELKADGNKVTSLEGLERMDGLVKLSVQGNRIRSIDFERHRWTRLEMLNISHNRVDSLTGLASLPSLIALNLDNNLLDKLELDGPMPRLKILRASGNRISELNTNFVPNVRTLYVDNNALTSLVKLDRLRRLENLSLRNQSGKGCNLMTRDTRDVKRLYLSGNALDGRRFMNESCYNLVYLELAACRLRELPEGLKYLIPNVRVLNLNYNFLEETGRLEGLSRLQKLTIIGSRLKGTKALIGILEHMPEVEMLDFRMNPCTLGWYLPLLVKDVPGALQPSEEGGAGSSVVKWQELDKKFRRDLPNSTYVGRLAYRGLVMRACPRIRMLDGIEVTEKERAKASEVLAGILGRRIRAK